MEFDEKTIDVIIFVSLIIIALLNMILWKSFLMHFLLFISSFLTMISMLSGCNKD